MKNIVGNFPVIFLTLKGAEALTYNDAQAALSSIIGCEAMRFQFLLESEQLSSKEKEQYAQLIRIDTSEQHMFDMPKDVLTGSLKTLSALLHKHYDQKEILLIDEYNVPLDKAQQHGYYNEMMDLIRSLFGHTLKTNEHLFFAVLTGCLRVAKESIFTGLNNFKSKKENFYHGIPLGLLSHREDWLLFSSAASGQDYSDILIELPEEDLGIACRRNICMVWMSNCENNISL